MRATNAPNAAHARKSALAAWLSATLSAAAFLTVLLIVAGGDKAYGLAANKVWFKILAPGRYRVYVNVTIPELKQYREYHVDFRSFRKASDFFWQLAKGADFYPPRKNQFQTKPDDYTPW